MFSAYGCRQGQCLYFPRDFFVGHDNFSMTDESYDSESSNPDSVPTRQNHETNHKIPNLQMLESSKNTL